MADPSDRTLHAADSPDGPDPELAGRALGDFELLRRIGAGGMGRVYLARQTSLKRSVAVKVLKRELAANTAALRRFRAEAEAVATLTHPNIVQVHSIGTADGLHFMALEYVDGRTLRDYLDRKGPPELPFALSIIRQVACALDRAAEQGFVHRDIKPENILISRKGEVKVTDFGLSRCFATEAPTNLTQTGVTMGTPLYMSPEQVRGQAVDPRSDLYSFGVTCYHMFAGEPPFRAATAFDVALQHVQSEPRPLGDIRPDLPAEIPAFVHKMMAKRPEDRFQSARDVLRELGRVEQAIGVAGTAMSWDPPAFSDPFPIIPASHATVPLPTRRPLGRYAVVAVLAVAAMAAGAAIHWARTPPVAVASADDVWGDIDPDPDLARERDLKKILHDKTIRTEVATEKVLDLAELYIRERRPADALKLFEMDSLRKLEAFSLTGRDAIQNRDLLPIVSGLGRGVVLANMDRADESNREFQRLLSAYPLGKGEAGGPKLKQPARGQLEQFFRGPAGADWRRAVGDALERNTRNLGRMPDDLRRLRFSPKVGGRPGKDG